VCTCVGACVVRVGACVRVHVRLRACVCVCVRARAFILKTSLRRSRLIL